MGGGWPQTVCSTATLVVITYGGASTTTPPPWRRRRYPVVTERCTAKAPFPVPVRLAAVPVPPERLDVQTLERPTSLARVVGAKRERRALRAGVERKDAA